MTTSKNIQKQIEKETAKLENIKKSIDNILNSCDFTGSRLEAIKARHEHKEANAEELSKLSKDQSFTEKKIAILNNNLHYVTAFDLLEKALAIVAKYTGKRYGEATKAKMQEEAKKQSFNFYFSDSKAICIIPLNQDGFSYCVSYTFYITAGTVGNPAYILIDNVIQDVTQYNTSDFSCYDFGAYIENIGAYIKKIVAAYEKVKASEKELQEAMSIYSDLTRNFKKFNHISGGYVQTLYADCLR